MNKLSVMSFANCSESANNDGYKHNFYTVPQTPHLSFQKSWELYSSSISFHVLLNMHALTIIIIFITVIIVINIISNITLLFLLLLLLLLLLFINHLSMVNFNVRSLRGKSDDPINYLNSLSFSFSLTALTETWLNESYINDETQIPGYRSIIVNRKHKKLEALAFKLKMILTTNYEMIFFIRNSSEDIGNIFIEITTNRGKNIKGE